MKLPQSFLDLHAAGRFDYWGGKRYHDMEDAERARLLSERRDEVLWLRNIEWEIEPEGVAEVDWARPGLFAFAGNGAGDQYAWYPTWQGDAPEPPVILVLHDEYVSKVFAPSFALTLYRLWLEHAADSDSDNGGDGRASALRAWAGIIAPQLEDDVRATLEALAVDLEAAKLQATLDAFVASLPSTELATALQPTRYNPEYVKGEHAKRAYARSIAFFDALVEEGHEGFRRHADEARANRDAALALEERAARLKAVVSKPKPEKTTAPKAKPAKKAAPKKAAKAKPAKKAAAKKSPLKPAAPRKATAAKAPPKKGAAQKAVEKAVEKAVVTAAKAVGKALKKAAKAAKKSAAKKAAPKKAKKSAAKKAAPKKAAPKKAAGKKAAKKTAPKKPKTATPKKATKKSGKKRAPKKAKKAPSRKARR